MHRNPSLPAGLKTRTALAALVCALAVLSPLEARAEQSRPWSPPSVEDERATEAPETGIRIESGQDQESVMQQEETPAHEAAPETGAVQTTPWEAEPVQSAFAPPAQEFLGFTPLDDQRSLGNDVFRGSTRSVLTDLFKSLTTRDANPTIHKTTNRLLLTAGRKSDIINDTKPAAGEDLLTIRLEKMLDRGLYAEASSIYTSLDAEPYHERLAAAGLTALIVTGRKSLACLDIKTFFEGKAETAAWKELGAYCNYVMAIASGAQPPEQTKTDPQYAIAPALARISRESDYREHYSPRTFDRFSQFERAVILGENRLVVDMPTLREDLKQDRIPPAHVQVLLQLPTLDIDTRMRLIATGIRSASVSSDTLYSLFKTAQTDKMTESPAAGLINIYRRIKAKEPDNDLPAMMRTALRMNAAFGPEAMIPLLSTLEGIDPNLLDPMDYSAALAVFIAAERDLPPLWKESLGRREIPDALNPPSLRDTLLIQTYLVSDPQARTPTQKKTVRDILTTRGLAALQPSLDIIENVDKDNPPLNNGPKVYENGFDSSPDKGYTMATAQPQERLKQAASANAIGETVLLSNLVFRRASAEPFSPEALIEVTGSMRTVGLYDQAQAMLADAVFAAIK